MAKILLLDGSEVAQRAMQGILARANHQCTIASEGPEAWKLLRDQTEFDLLFLELNLKEEPGINFIQRLRNDRFLKWIPIVVYTNVSKHDVVLKALSLEIQNYLLKPYNDDSIYTEVAKAMAHPWRQHLFENEKTFCARTNLTPEELKEARARLVRTLDESLLFFSACNDSNFQEVTPRIDEIAEKSEEAGIPSIPEFIRDMRSQETQNDWHVVKACMEDMALVRRLLDHHLHPPATLLESPSVEQERKIQKEALDRTAWLAADVHHGTHVPVEEVEKQLASLPSCPVIDTVAAAFQMMMEGQGANFTRLMDLVTKDPGLCAQVLIAANRLEREGMSAVEDPRSAVTLLGDIKLKTLAKSMPLIEARHMNFPPITWVHFWRFQVGVARVAEYACRHMEFSDLSANAYTAGLLHDLGKLLLLRLYPCAFEAITRYAKLHGISVPAAEKLHLGLSTREMADIFAAKHNMPAFFGNVIRWINTPDKATEDPLLVAVVSMARDLCVQNRVGYCSEMPSEKRPAIEDTVSWRVLRRRVFPSFELRKFEAQAQSFCEELKKELQGLHF